MFHVASLSIVCGALGKLLKRNEAAANNRSNFLLFLLFQGKSFKHLSVFVIE
jgi:hypothetical protein